MAKHKETVADKIKSSVKNWVGKKLTERITLHAPFPYDPVEFHRSLAPEPAWLAAERLIELGIVVDRGRTMVISHTPGDKTLYLALPELSITVSRPFMMLQPEYRDTLTAWLQQRTTMTAERAVLLERINQVADVCKTFGHFQRMWPTAAMCGDATFQAAMRAKRAQSPYPEGAYVWSNKSHGLKDEFKPETLWNLDHVLAELLMLPDQVPMDTVQIR